MYQHAMSQHVFKASLMRWASSESHFTAGKHARNLYHPQPCRNIQGRGSPHCLLGASGAVKE